MPHHHLSLVDRTRLEIMRRQGDSQSAMAAAVGCHRSTVSRELKRNASEHHPGRGDDASVSRGDNASVAHGYDAGVAQQRAGRRRQRASSAPRKLTDAMWAQVCVQMETYRSVVLAVRGLPVGRQAVYNRCHHELLGAAPASPGRPRNYSRRRRQQTPHCHMRHGVGRQCKGVLRRTKSVMSGGLPIAQRPAVVARRTRRGDWEVDTVRWGRQRNAAVAVVLVERKSRLILGRLLPEHSAPCTAEAIIELLRGYPVHTITSDRGSEFARWRSVESALAAKWYVCDVRRPDQRGQVENAIGWLRWGQPRNLAPAEVTEQALQREADFLNHRPRPVLNYRSAAEVMGRR